MKASYYTTPRTIRDCTFSDWADPIQLPKNGPGLYWRFIHWLTK